MKNADDYSQVIIVAFVCLALLFGIGGCVAKGVIAELRAPVEVENARSTEQNEN
jgi:hypothetical protein